MNLTTKKECPFCKMGRHEMDHVAVLRDKDILVVMDLYPATPRPQGKKALIS